MCGIAGFIDYGHNSTEEILKNCTDVLSHRGPDGCGYEFLVDEKYQLGLGHRRLSILDTSECGSQPMWYDQWCIVFNGEIYNFQEIKTELLKFGHKFNSTSDTEVILHAFQHWGPAMIDHFIGMFSFVLLDALKQRLYCFRDRAGVKPFYFYTKGDLFLFSSELKSFHKHPGFKKIICEEAVFQYLQYGYIMAPLTIYKHTYKLRPGYFMQIEIPKLIFEELPYWEVLKCYQKPKLDISKEEAEKEVEKLLTSACNYRMISDVPVGVFLSGGYDSTAVTALIQANRTDKIKTYTIGFHEADHNEADHAKKVATHLGTDHTEYYCTAKEAQGIIPTIPFYCDEPFGDSSIIPTMLVSKLARKDVTVALSADAGDETFAGYPKYPLSINILKKLNLVPDILRYPTGSILNIIPGSWLLKLTGHTAAAIKKQRLAEALKKEKFTAVGIMDEFLSQVYSDKQMQSLIKRKIEKPRSGFFEYMPNVSKMTDLDRMLLVDYRTYLPDDIFVKVDRAGMSVSLEGREPLSDHRLVEFAAQLPDHLKMKGNDKKIILKDIVHKYVPREIMDRPKMGFGVPVADWLKTDLKFYVDEYMNDAAFAKHDLFHQAGIDHIKRSFFAGDRNYNTIFWYLLMFQMWYKEWMD